MSSLSDQLLKAGLVTEEQVKKATEKPKFKPKKIAAKKTNKKIRNEQSDLAKFYGERKQQENKEKQEKARKKQEAARLKKEMNESVKTKHYVFTLTFQRKMKAFHSIFSL